MGDSLSLDGDELDDDLESLSSLSQSLSQTSLEDDLTPKVHGAPTPVGPTLAQALPRTSPPGKASGKRIETGPPPATSGPGAAPTPALDRHVQPPWIAAMASRPGSSAGQSSSGAIAAPVRPLDPPHLHQFTRPAPAPRPSSDQNGAAAHPLPAARPAAPLAGDVHTHAAPQPPTASAAPPTAAATEQAPAQASPPLQGAAPTSVNDRSSLDNAPPAERAPASSSPKAAPAPFAPPVADPPAASIPSPAAPATSDAPSAAAAAPANEADDAAAPAQGRVQAVTPASVPSPLSAAAEHAEAAAALPAAASPYPVAPWAPVQLASAAESDDKARSGDYDFFAATPTGGDEAPDLFGQAEPDAAAPEQALRAAMAADGYDNDTAARESLLAAPLWSSAERGQHEAAGAASVLAPGPELHGSDGAGVRQPEASGVSLSVQPASEQQAEAPVSETAAEPGFFDHVSPEAFTQQDGGEGESAAYAYNADVTRDSAWAAEAVPYGDATYGGGEGYADGGGGWDPSMTEYNGWVWDMDRNEWVWGGGDGEAGGGEQAAPAQADDFAARGASTDDFFGAAGVGAAALADVGVAAAPAADFWGAGGDHGAVPEGGGISESWPAPAADRPPQPLAAEGGAASAELAALPPFPTQPAAAAAPPGISGPEQAPAADDGDDFFSGVTSAFANVPHEFVGIGAAPAHDRQHAAPPDGARGQAPPGQPPAPVGGEWPGVAATNGSVGAGAAHTADTATEKAADQAPSMALSEHGAAPLPPAASAFAYGATHQASGPLARVPEHAPAQAAAADDFFGDGGGSVHSAVRSISGDDFFGRDDAEVAAAPPSIGDGGAFSAHASSAGESGAATAGAPPGEVAGSSAAGGEGVQQSGPTAAGIGAVQQQPSASADSGAHLEALRPEVDAEGVVDERTADGAPATAAAAADVDAYPAQPLEGGQAEAYAASEPYWDGQQWVYPQQAYTDPYGGYQYDSADAAAAYDPYAAYGSSAFDAAGYGGGGEQPYWDGQQWIYPAQQDAAYGQQQWPSASEQSAEQPGVLQPAAAAASQASTSAGAPPFAAPYAPAGAQGWGDAGGAAPSYPSHAAPQAHSQGHGGWGAPAYGGMDDGGVPSYQSSSAAPDYGAQASPAYSRPASDHAPRNIHEALTSSAGRPPRAFVAFGMGGACAFLRPPARAEATLMHSPPAAPPALVLAPLPVLAAVLEDPEAVLPQKKRRPKPPPWAPHFAALQEFPGPLAASTSPAALARFADACAREEAARGAERMALLWRVLGLAAKHKGKLSAVPGSKDPGSGAQDEIAALLYESLGPSMPKAGGMALLHDVQPRPSQKDAHELQAMIVTGRVGDALERALAARQWPLATLIARALGENALNRTLALMAHDLLRPGTSLHTFGLMASQDYAGAAASIAGGGPQSPPAPSSPVPAGRDAFGADAGGGGPLASPTSAGTLRPAPSLGAPPGVATLELPGNAWAPTLIMLAANRMAGNHIMLGTLGDRLWGVPGPSRAGGDRVSAHLCYVLAGRLMEGALDAESRFVLPGADHETHRGTFASSAAVQRAELFTWCLQQSNSAIPMFGIAPYMLLYAARLAEVGLVAKAEAYCAQAIALAQKAVEKRAALTFSAPYVLATAQVLQERLKGHGKGRQTGSAMSAGGVLRFFDAQLSKLIGSDGPPSGAHSESASISGAHVGSWTNLHGADGASGPPAPAGRPYGQQPASVPGLWYGAQPPGSGPPSASSSVAAPAGPGRQSMPLLPDMYPGGPPAPGGPSSGPPSFLNRHPADGGPPPGAAQPGPRSGPGGDAPPGGDAATGWNAASPMSPSRHRRIKSEDGIAQHSPDSAAVARAAKERVMPEKKAAAEGGGARPKASWLSGVIGMVRKASNKDIKTADLGDSEQTLYYDHEKKRWRERGREDEAVEEAPPPPPKSTGWAARSDAAATSPSKAAAGRPPIAPGARAPAAPAGIANRYAVASVPAASAAAPAGPRFGAGPAPPALRIPGAGSTAGGAAGVFVPQLPTLVSESGSSQLDAPASSTPGTGYPALPESPPADQGHGRPAAAPDEAPPHGSAAAALDQGRFLAHGAAPADASHRPSGALGPQLHHLRPPPVHFAAPPAAPTSQPGWSQRPYSGEGAGAAQQYGAPWGSAAPPAHDVGPPGPGAWGQGAGNADMLQDVPL